MAQQSWHQHLKQQLLQREQQDVLPFKGLITACTHRSYRLLITSVDSEAIHREEAILDEIETSREHQANLETTIKTMDAELTAFKT